MPTRATQHDARGRGASKVAEIPRAGWKDIFWRTYSEVIGDHVMLIAAGVTFYALLALVPGLTALVSIYGLFADPVTLDRHMELLEGLIPSGGLDIVREQLRRLAEQGQTKLGLTSLVAFAIALWSANSGVKSMFEAMNVAYDEEEKRSYLRLTAVTMVFTLATFAAILLLIGLIVVLPTVLQLIGLGTAAQWAARAGGLVLMLLLMLAGLAALYRFGPSRHAAQWRWITPGAVLAMVVILVTSGLFTWYVASFGSYDATYGSLGAIFGFMTWLWICRNHRHRRCRAQFGDRTSDRTRHHNRTATPDGTARRGDGRHGRRHLWRRRVRACAVNPNLKLPHASLSRWAASHCLPAFCGSGGGPAETSRPAELRRLPVPRPRDRNVQA